MTGCQTCGGFGNRHDPVAHGTWGDEEFVAEELCRCGHEHLRHDMGHGCIECRCRRFQRGPVVTHDEIAEVVFATINACHAEGINDSLRQAHAIAVALLLAKADR